MPPDEPTAVARRHVFFLAGFDRKSPRYYHALYRSQARRQAAVSDMALEVSRERSQPTANSTAWTTNFTTHDASVHTTHELLEWHDIVTKHWSTSAWRVLMDGAATVEFWLREGAIQRMYRLFKPPVYATIFPLLVLALCASMAIASGAGLAWASSAMAGMPALLSAAIGALAAALLIELSVKLVHRIQITWLLRLVRFTQLQAMGVVPELDRRLSAFAQRIAAVASAEGDDAPDEILVIGHSVGANLAIGVLARVLDLQASDDARKHSPITLLSLGHCMPLLSSLGAAADFRRDMQRVAMSDINWLDITAPIDWAAFPQVDPVSAADLPCAPAGWHPRLLSPRFHRLFSETRYARLKHNRFQVHMQYLMASEYPGRYDYFAITAGSQTLRERFEQPDDDETPLRAPGMLRQQSAPARE